MVCPWDLKSMNAICFLRFLLTQVLKSTRERKERVLNWAEFDLTLSFRATLRKNERNNVLLYPRHGVSTSVIVIDHRSSLAVRTLPRLLPRFFSSPNSAGGDTSWNAKRQSCVQVHHEITITR